MPAGDAADEPRRETPIERFVDEPTRDLADWRGLWNADRRFPIRSHRGLLGRLVVFAKRLLRPLIAAPQADLWERQRIFNLILLEYLQRGEDLRRVVLEAHAEKLGYLDAQLDLRVGQLEREHSARLNHLEAVWREGLADVMGHNDALFARVDQKVDRLQRETREVWSRLGSALAVAEREGATALSRVREEHSYLELENRFRGTEEEIADRIAPYLELLRGRGEVLDLGCGRGEALALFRSAGIPARGIDASAAMVEECLRKEVAAERSDLLDGLAAAQPESLGGVVSFHVVEHLPPEAIDRLVRLAHRALKPGGVLILETPNPLSLVVAARNFWIDPTHRRPVHPETLSWIFRQAGFDPVERLEFRPFAASERLPEIELELLPEPQRALAHQVNGLRDRLDELLFGAQDYALVGTKPAR